MDVAAADVIPTSPRASRRRGAAEDKPLSDDLTDFFRNSDWKTRRKYHQSPFGMARHGGGRHAMPRSVASTATLALVVVVFAIAPPPTAAHGSETNGVAPVLLISLDGFRASYLDAQPAAALPHLTSFWRGGVRAALTPRFVSKTFPNHYSIVTGTHERAHGIVANRFWDPYTQSWFTMDATTSYWWDAAEPLWVTASRDARASNVYYWPGSEAEIRGRRPDVWKRFEHGVVPFEERVDYVARWLRDAHAAAFHHQVRSIH